MNSKAKIKEAANAAQQYLNAAHGELPTEAAGVYALMALATMLTALGEYIADEDL